MNALDRQMALENSSGHSGQLAGQIMNELEQINGQYDDKTGQFVSQSNIPQQTPQNIPQQNRDMELEQLRTQLMEIIATDPKLAEMCQSNAELNGFIRQLLQDKETLINLLKNPAQVSSILMSVINDEEKASVSSESEASVQEQKEQKELASPIQYPELEEKKRSWFSLVASSLMDPLISVILYLVVTHSLFNILTHKIAPYIASSYTLTIMLQAGFIFLIHLALKIAMIVFS